MPVLYWSSLFRTYERNYAILEKEALACVAVVGKLKKYLLGRIFLLMTDHRSLETLLSQGNCGRTGARIERWRERYRVMIRMWNISKELTMRWRTGYLDLHSQAITRKRC